jgi:adenine-specific DNA-methyltransferase
LKGKNYKFENPDNDKRGPWFSGSVSFSEDRSNKNHPNYYQITSPSGIVWERQWQCPEDEMRDYLNEKKIYFGTSPKYDNVPRLKIFPTDKEEIIPPNIFDDVGTTRQAQKYLDSLFNIDNLFDNPKPVDLIKKIIEMSTEEKDIILDSFAGSGTSAEATISIEGNRKFILIQLPEKINKDASAYKKGYRYIHEITRDRVKKVIERDKLKLGFTYYKLGTLIDSDSILSGKLPKYGEFAKYVYYLATGKNHPDEKKIKEKDFFTGKSNNESIYLMYKQNVNELKNLSITLDWAQKINEKDSGQKIVYAPACFLDDEHLEKFNIKFVSIPYNLFERK